MRALAIVRRDLLRHLRNPLRTALLFAVPLVVAGVLALAFGGDAGEQISIRILLFDEDQSLFGRLLQGAASSGQADGRLDLVAVGAEGAAMIERGEASALVHVPTGFTADFLAGRPTTIGVVKNPSQRFLPKVVEEGIGLAAAVLSTTSRVVRPELGQIAAMSEGDTAASDAAVAAVSTGFSGVLRDTGSYLFPPALSFRTVSSRPAPDEAEEAATSTTAAILTAILPGLAVMGVLFVAQSASRDVVRDRERGLVRHLLTTPTTVADYLLGKTLSVLVASVLAFVIFIVLGLAAGVAWGPPLPTLLLVVATSLAVTGTLLLVNSAVSTERQGDAVTTIVVIVSSLLGGAIVPVSQIPAGLLPLARMTAVYWATDGFARLTAGEGTAAIVPNLAILVTGGFLFLAAGNLLLRRRLSGGRR